MKTSTPLIDLLIDDNEAFAKILTNARNKLGMTQQDLADSLYVSTATISKWESAKARPERSRLMEIAQVIQVPYIILSLALDDALSGKDHYIMVSKQENTHLKEQVIESDYRTLQEHMLEYNDKKLFLDENNKTIINAISLTDDEYTLYKYICDFKPAYPVLKYFCEIILPYHIRKDAKEMDNEENDQIQ